MVVFIIIPLTIVAIAGTVGYLVYRFLLKDFLANRSVNATLREFNIKKTQFEIIKEYHAFKGKEISDKEITHLQKRYRQHEPDKFLSMYDSMRDRTDTKREN